MITIVYLTFRDNPRFEWFRASLSRELRDAPDFDRSRLQVLIIDGKHPRSGDPFDFGFSVERHSPKPTVWQGTHRLTGRNYFCAANTRNTAFALARYGHVAFVDDLSVLLPGWLNAHRHAATHEYVLCGTTCKRKNIEVTPDGEIAGYEDFPPGTDSRLKFLSPNGLLKCGGAWLYGGTFSVPLEHALRVNGQDEIHDTIGGEDYDFGERLERSGSGVFISSACGTLEDEDGHNTQVPMIRVDKPWPPSEGARVRIVGDKGNTLTGLDKAIPGIGGPYSSNYLLNRLRCETDRFWTLGNQFDLRKLRDRVLAGEPFPIPTEPTHHWVDGQPLSEM